MTTESGSDSESKPEQEAEPQEAAGAQGHAGAPQGPGPEPSGEEQHQALEQFEAAAHSTPVRKEVSPGTQAATGSPAPASITEKPNSGMFTDLFQGRGRPWSLSTRGNYEGSSVYPFWSQADGNLCYFKTFSEGHSTTLLGNSLI